jgi:hypothetical protein
MADTALTVQMNLKEHTVQLRKIAVVMQYGNNCEPDKPMV